MQYVTKSSNTVPDMLEIRKSNRNWVKDYNKPFGDTVIRCRICHLLFMGLAYKTACKVCNGEALWSIYKNQSRYISLVPIGGYEQECTCSGCNLVRQDFEIWKREKGYSKL